jgi:hypothetical protein
MSFISDIFAAKTGADAAGYAARLQSDTANRATDLQNEQYQQTRADNAPLLGARNDALSQIQNLLKNPQGITNDPGYQFGMDQGTRALNSGAAARGMTYSGAAGKALARFGQDYAGTKLDASYNRLSNLAGMGQVGANNNQQAGMNYANNAGNNMIGAANAGGAAAMSGARGWGNALNSVSAYGQRNGWFGGSGQNLPITNGGGFSNTPNYLITDGFGGG